MDESHASTLPENPVEGSPPGPEWVSTEFENLYLAHSGVIYYTALRLLGDPAAAEDATHDVFLKAFRNISEFKGRSSWRTWLYRITINHCLNLRSRWDSRKITAIEEELGWEPSTPGTDPLQALETKELGTRIQKALDSLKEEQRLILLLAADEQMTYSDIGALIEQTEDSVRGKLHRARKAFLVAFGKTA